MGLPTNNNLDYLPYTRVNSTSRSNSWTEVYNSNSSNSNDRPSSPAGEKDRLHLLPDLAAYFPLSTTPSLWRKRLFALFHITSLAFALIGIYTLIGFNNGRFMRTPVYSAYDIAQTGYSRQLAAPVAVLSPEDETRSNSIDNNDSLPPFEYDEDRIRRPSTTTLQTWTFPGQPDPDFGTPPAPFTESSDQHLLILSPIRNAHSILPTYFRHLENLQHPKENTSIGFLLSDEEDETGVLVQHWCDEQTAKGEYRHITLLRKDFGLMVPQGQARHENWIQAQRRGLMARARTLLLMSTINPTVDWVFWLDADVAEMPSTIIGDLMQYGLVDSKSSASLTSSPAEGKILADIVIPNVVKRHRGTFRGYDLSMYLELAQTRATAVPLPLSHKTDLVPAEHVDNWAETPESIEMKKTLDPDIILHEGDGAFPTHRLHLARQWIAPNVTLDPFLPRTPQESDEADENPSDLYDPASPAYIGRQVPLDAVGGVATLVRASVHLFGGVFPSWNVDHAVETEGFGLLAKLVGARVVGLPNYLVIHR